MFLSENHLIVLQLQKSGCPYQSEFCIDALKIRILYFWNASKYKGVQYEMSQTIIVEIVLFYSGVTFHNTFFFNSWCTWALNAIHSDTLIRIFSREILAQKKVKNSSDLRVISVLEVQKQKQLAV